MAKGFAICKMSGDGPELDREVTPFSGYTVCGWIGRNWCAVIVSGTAAQLQAINALPNVYGICAVTESGDIKWAELDETVAPAVRTRLNNWLTARGQTTIPAAWTYRRIVNTVYKRLNDKFDLAAFDVDDPA